MKSGPGLTEDSPELVSDEAVDGEVGGRVEGEQGVGDAVGGVHGTSVQRHRPVTLHTRSTRPSSSLPYQNRVNWVSGSLDYRVTGSLGHKM